MTHAGEGDERLLLVTRNAEIARQQFGYLPRWAALSSLYLEQSNSRAADTLGKLVGLDALLFASLL